MFPWVANARAVMQNETTGWVKSIHESRYGELLGLVMVGPHVTDLIEAGVVAIDAEATVETVADGMAAHPTSRRRSRKRVWWHWDGRSTCRTGNARRLQRRSVPDSASGRTAKTAISSAAPTRTVSSPTTSASGPTSAWPAGMKIRRPSSRTSSRASRS